ncbi:MAG TPA: metal ABC transporter permease [Candidatus Acidoferrales bacterium]|nr:metal ABC transporter permease [Candidatus Acidoferrales bacterium]
MADQPSWDLLADLQLILQFHFMQNALLVGTLVALLAGAIGYFVVLRGQSFAAHMLSQVGFPGAAAGALLHTSPALGLVVFCVGGALGVSWTGRSLDAGRRAESAAVGSILAFSLALGLLFFRLYAGSAQGIYGFLFGSILGITDRDVLVAAATTLAGLAVVAVIGRPLLFVSVDPEAAEARGVPVRAVSVLFLVLVALSVAETVQVIGTLLVFALLVTPGAAAQQLTARPGLGLALTIALALLFVWGGLALAYFSLFPVGFFVTSLAFATYLGIRMMLRAAAGSRPPAHAALGSAS